MIDIFDLIHYLIGLAIVSLLVWLIIKTHTYFSKDNIPLDSLIQRQILV
jgi:hypothetical protein